MIGFLILLAIVSQYIIGLTATFQIVMSISRREFSVALIVAIGTLIFLACGIIFYGIMVIKSHEKELRDVGTYDHTKKSIKPLSILRKHKSALNACQPFLEWHLKETGHLKDETMTLKDTPHHFTRETLMKRLHKRCNCEALRPMMKR